MIAPLIDDDEEQGVVSFQASGAHVAGMSDVERTRVRLLVVP